MKNILKLLEHSNLGVVILSEFGEVINANSNFNQWIGANNPPASVKLHYSFTALDRHIKKLNATPSLKHLECRFQLHRAGLASPFTMHGVLMAAPQGEQTFTCGLICWLDESPPIKPSELDPSRLNNLFLNIPTGIITLNANWKCDFINPEFSILTEKSEKELAGQGWLNLFKSQPEQLTDLIKNATQHGSARTELTIVRLGHNTKTLEFKFKAHLDSNGQFESGFGALIDISERVTHEAKIHRLANYDSVTGLPNRQATIESLSNYIKSALKNKQSLQMLYIDLDGFQGINDLYGHQVGDELLKGVAQRIMNFKRSSDIVSRFGGDEFIVLVPGNSANETVDQLAEQIIENINVPFYIDDLRLHISASIGIATYTPDTLSNDVPSNYVQVMTQDLFQRADITLYCAKQAGKDQFIRFSNDKTEKVTELYNILQKLPHAIENQLFTMMYQPIVDTKTGKVTAVEALVRWYDDELQWIGPDKFIPIAETHGKIMPVQQCMINHVCRDITTTFQHFSTSKTPIRITINLSGVQLADTKNLMVFLDNFQQQGIQPEQITLEITEHILIEETPALIKCLTDIKQRGFTIALDDFGTGYSSLSYLAKVPMNSIKLDKSFVDPIESSPLQKALVKGVIYLAKSLKLTVVAEGVENKAQMEILEDFGCDYIQGYLIAKPMKAKALMQWLENNHER